ncbi:hypothetical protein [Raineyella sp. LH-20]|uniref:hypothetical protein n=1 Tax=Raineyella sp. LH-20 TaxID=3081204 RepID=UPI0029553D8E|nr:hypothetical protein [Raineyella sp. LH-20]WOP18195.1 hypothetical protein R0146_13315 [Raineyella sp. LH-20]
MIPIIHALLETAVMVAGALLAVGIGGPIVTAVFRHVDRAEGVTPPTLGSGADPAKRTDAAAVSTGTEDAGATGTTRTTEATGTREAEAVPETQSLQGAARVLRGGRWIGRLERLTIFVSLVAGYPNGAAVAVAVKALARYPELKSTTSAAAERFIIGTFVSVLWAAGCAALASWIVTLF